MTRSSRASPNQSTWSAPFWDAVAEGRLVIQACLDCDRPIMYPKRICPYCLSEQLTWRESAGQGEVYSFTVQEAGPPSGFEDLVPYVLAIVRLEEGVQMMANVVGPDASATACGDRVRVEFQEVDGGMTLPVFRRTGASAADEVPGG
ncbi:MAG: hypothetical protein JWL77_6920 [Chthonomonadaceae bacterium]|nr:hypothetical protein [Chthonomonadaceae bacterium]